VPEKVELARLVEDHVSGRGLVKTTTSSSLRRFIAVAPQKVLDLRPDRRLGRIVIGPIDGEVVLDPPDQRTRDLGQLRIDSPLI
jgi:hypothetical protein